MENIILIIAMEAKSKKLHSVGTRKLTFDLNKFLSIACIVQHTVVSVDSCIKRGTYGQQPHNFHCYQTT